MRLQIEREIADLIEKESATVGGSDETDAARSARNRRLPKALRRPLRPTGLPTTPGPGSPCRVQANYWMRLPTTN